MYRLPSEARAITSDEYSGYRAGTKAVVLTGLVEYRDAVTKRGWIGRAVKGLLQVADGPMDGVQQTSFHPVAVVTGKAASTCLACHTGNQAT